MLGVLALRLDDPSDVLGGLRATARRVPLELRCRPTDLDQELLLLLLLLSSSSSKAATTTLRRSCRLGSYR